jgi:hypothetical protein
MAAPQPAADYAIERCPETSANEKPGSLGIAGRSNGATGRPACCQHPDHYRRGRHIKAEETVERGAAEYCSPSSGWCLKRAVLAIEVHRHSAAPFLSSRNGPATLSPLTENENRRSIVGYRQRCMPALLH